MLSLFFSDNLIDLYSSLFILQHVRITPISERRIFIF